MRLVLINPPYRAVTSKFGVGEQIPLGPIAVDGPGDAGKRADSERGTPGDLGKA